MMRHCGGAIVILITLVSAPAYAQIEAQHAKTVSEWLSQEHVFLRRYLAVVRQAAHDYSYGYKTPALLMPVAVDLFTGYAVYIHEAEAQFLYPALRPHMTPEQQESLKLIEVDQLEENNIVKSWKQDLLQYDAGSKKLTDVAVSVDNLARMVNRHIVLQEERVFPFLDSLTPQDQTKIAHEIERFYQRMLGLDGSLRYNQLLSYIEGQIKAIAGRIW